MATNGSTTKKSTVTKAELEAQIELLKAQLAAATAANGGAPATSTVAQAPVVNVTAPSTDVTLVYCSESMGYAKTNSVELFFNRFGEEYTLTRPQFDELVGKYRKWFDKGVLAVSYKNVDIAAAKGVRTDKEYALSHSLLESIGRMSTAQLEKLWEDTIPEAHKQSIVCFIKRKFMEGDPGYTDRAKIDLMNRLTNGGFAREQDELGGRYKIQPTEF